MMNDELWRRYVLRYPIAVPQEEVEEELYRIKADMKHRMVYANMTGAETHLFPDAELAEQADELMEAAVFEVKELLVLRDLAKKLDVSVMPEELLARGEAIAQRQNTTIEEVKRFFGEDLSLLERDVRDDKIRAWAVEQG